MSQVAVREEPRTSINSVAFGREAGGANLAPQNLGDIVRFAEVMSKADIAIPKHLRMNPGACLAVCMQAFKWEMDPFSVAQKSYKVGDQMAYEAQLIAAVINTRAGLKRRPAIDYEGDGPDRVCIVTFDADDGSQHVYRSPRFAAITTKNSPLWKSDPDQQLGYYSIRAGARRHFPEVILGVYDRDEIAEARDVTPPADQRSGFAARIAAQRADPAPSAPQEGFTPSFIDGELRGSQEAPAAEIEGNAGGGADVRQDRTTETGQPAGGGDEQVLDTPAGDHEELGSEALQDKALDPAGSGTVDDPDHVDPADEREEPTITESDRKKLAGYAQDLFGLATGDGDAALRRDRIGKAHQRWKTDLAGMSEDVQKMAGAILSAAQAINKGEVSVERSAEYFAEVLDVPLADVMPAGGQ